VLSADARLALVREAHGFGYGLPILAPAEALPVPKDAKEPEKLNGKDGEVSYQPQVEDPVEPLPPPAPTGGAFQLWDMVKGRLLRRFAGHQDTVTSVAFSPKGRFMLSSSLDGSIRVWIYPDPESVPVVGPSEPLRERPLFFQGPPAQKMPEGEKIPEPLQGL
jgi:hypothetical protein